MNEARAMLTTRDIPLSSQALPEVVEAGNWRDLYFTARDGLRLYARHYPAPGSVRRPLLCLAGLTRNSRDFHHLASVLSSPEVAAPREVFALDYRGRGRSAHDPDWRNYQILNELLDVLDFMIIAGLHDAALVGTSRGGILAMIMAAIRPTSIGAAVLNDIGPVIEREGLLRIMAYVGKIPLPATWAEAASQVRGMAAPSFPAVPEHQWEGVARQWYNDDNGLPSHGYDQALHRALGTLDGPLPELWPQFRALARVPAMVLRGETSDILSVETAVRMQREHPDLTLLTVAGQGHAPLLMDAPSLTAIMAFLERADGLRPFHG